MGYSVRVLGAEREVQPKTVGAGVLLDLALGSPFLTGGSGLISEAVSNPKFSSRECVKVHE